jgi:hypothetical protein
MEVSGQLHASAEERGEMQTKFWLENMKGRDNLEELCIDDRIILERILEK